MYRALDHPCNEPQQLKHFYDFDTSKMHPLSEDGQSFHLDFTEPGTPNKHYEVNVQQKFVLRKWVLLGIDSSGCFVDYLNNRYRRYDQNGDIKTVHFSKRKDLVDQTIRDFPQFEEKHLSQCLDVAVSTNSSSTNGESIWPDNF